MFPAWMFRPRCWMRGSHRWRVPTRALLAEYRDQAVPVRCADCGCRRSVSGRDIQRHPPSGIGTMLGNASGGGR
jgi:hypothetical protein